MRRDWWIKVGDTGPGLPPKAREHLFTAFQGGARKGGSGLGLAISAELVRGHGGRLESVAHDAEGTEFVIRLPKGRRFPVKISMRCRTKAGALRPCNARRRALNRASVCTRSSAG